MFRKPCRAQRQAQLQPRLAVTSVGIVVSSATGIRCDGKGEGTLFSEALTAAGRREEGCFLEQAVLCGGQVPACPLDPPPCLPLSVSTQAPSLSQALPKGPHLSPQSHLLGQSVQTKKETDAIGDIFLALSRETGIWTHRNAVCKGRSSTLIRGQSWGLRQCMCHSQGLGM